MKRREQGQRPGYRWKRTFPRDRFWLARDPIRIASMFDLHNELQAAAGSRFTILIATFAPATLIFDISRQSMPPPGSMNLKEEISDEKGLETVAERQHRRNDQARSRSLAAKDARITQITLRVHLPTRLQIPPQRAATAPIAIAGTVTTRPRDEEAKESRKGRVADLRSQPGRHAAPEHRGKGLLVAPVHLRIVVSGRSSSSCSCSDCDYSDSYSSDEDCCSCDSRKPSRKGKA
ncbi:hypothetical protein WH47_03903 [Habropoda laboriosa]|uniref:Uncharacterized protein n=1 Tax=Habropoda laboriosa TaxID=597456 RepID=A0A0L7QU47_9HYME|nr:hypothetical protein WH47_03903 [Habropoda laboriosa]